MASAAEQLAANLNLGAFAKADALKKRILFTLGALLVYRPGWYFGFRRRVSTDVSFIPWADAHQLTMTARIALINRDAEVAAALYNIAV